MANNRMYLVHQPSGRRIKLGKRMGGGYYGAPSAPDLDAFFSEFDEHPPPDAFTIEYEIEANWDFPDKLQLVRNGQLFSLRWEEGQIIADACDGSSSVRLTREDFAQLTEEMLAFTYLD